MQCIFVTTYLCVHVPFVDNEHVHICLCVRVQADVHVKGVPKIKALSTRHSKLINLAWWPIFQINHSWFRFPNLLYLFFSLTLYE